MTNCLVCHMPMDRCLCNRNRLHRRCLKCDTLYLLLLGPTQSCPQCGHDSEDDWKYRLMPNWADDPLPGWDEMDMPNDGDPLDHSDN
jgi:hypothetical protein